MLEDESLIEAVRGLTCLWCMLAFEIWKYDECLRSD